MRLRLHWLFLLFILLSPSLSPGQDAEDDIQRWIQKIKDSGENSFRIPPGKYRLPAGGVTLNKLKNVTLHAEGVTWIATDLSSPALTMDHCENVTLSGLTIDYDPLPFTQGDIVAVDPNSRTIEVAVHQGYPELSNQLLEHKQVHLFSKNERQWDPRAPDYYPKEIQRLSPRLARMFFSQHASGFEKFEVGKRVALTIRKLAGVKIRAGCRGLHFKEVTLHAAPGIGFLTRFAEDGGIFEKVKVVPGPKPDGATEERLLSTSADAMNTAYTRKGPTIEGCEFAFMGDDGINLHGVLFPVIEWLDDRTLIVVRPHRGEPFDRLTHPGDEIRFLKANSYEIATTAKIAEMKVLKEKRKIPVHEAKELFPTSSHDGSLVAYEIHLQESVKDVPLGSFVEITSLHASDYLIRNNHFHDHRARGLRLMASNGRVENNRFERLKGAAISLGGEFAFWREAGWISNVEVLNNHITEVCQGSNILLKDSYTTGAISVFARVEPQGESTQFPLDHTQIRIHQNRIEGCDVNGISVSAACAVSITENQIRDVNRLNTQETGKDFGLNGQNPILIHQADVTLQGNLLE